MHETCLRPLGRTLKWFGDLRLSPRERKIAGELLHEITSRLRFLVDVGLDYLSLHRTASTLSGGESQRIQLASQIGTGLTGVLYVLDEPTIGLHPRDNKRLIQALKRLRDLGNTLLLVEHDREVIDAADNVLDFGPGAGSFGGEVTAAASPSKLRSKRKSLTGRYLAGKEAISIPSNRRHVDRKEHALLMMRRDDEPSTDELERDSLQPAPWLIVYGAREHNLKEIDVAFPLGRFTCVTGVSGSGKSTLVNSVLYSALASRIHRARLVPGGHERITGIERIDKVINVDQAPIGNSPTSNPATYTGVFDAIRELYAKLPTSKVRGYTPNRFSFNRAGGRCEVCSGMGQRCIEMHFLPDVWIECESCKGARYVAETLDVRYRGKSIADCLTMRITEAGELFSRVPKIRRMLRTLEDVGLGYLELGQAAPTLSGGEAQRVKLASELGRPSTGKTLYILDEPTTGLHFDDLKKLLRVLHRLVDLGNTVICIEHNLDVIKTADWVIDLGPEAGDAGGYVVAEGTPEHLITVRASRTGDSLRPVIQMGPLQPREVHDPAAEADAESGKPDAIDLGDHVKMPWELDGCKWHTVDHLDTTGNPVQWDPAVLRWLVDSIQDAGRFSETDWNHRTRIEIAAAKSQQWFCHFLTGHKELLEVSFRVPHLTFTQPKLASALNIKTLDERTDLPIYGQWSRVRVRHLKGVAGAWDDVRISLRDFKDVRKRDFRAFLKKAAAAYTGRVAAHKFKPELRAPWKANGEKWHLSQEAMSARQVARWQPAVLMSLIGRFKSIQRNLEFDWCHKTAIQIIDPTTRKRRGKIVTNMGRGLRVELFAQKNTLTPAQIDRLGEDTEIKSRPDGDLIIFWIRSLARCDTKQLRDVWRLCQTDPADERLRSA